MVGEAVWQRHYQPYLENAPAHSGQDECMKKNPLAIGFVNRLVYGLVAVLISLRYHFFIVVWLIAVGAQILGSLYGAKYFYKEHMDKDWLKLLFWSNTFAWVIPPVGFFISAATRIINLRNQADDHKVFARLAAIGFWLSFINAIILAKLLIHS